MRAIAHISDLHFGRHDPLIAEALIADLTAEKPDLVAVSGDLTQRARRHEFAAAGDFLGRLGVPVIAVPGNHDMPLYNPLRRVLRPLERFRHHITPQRDPFFTDGEIAVLGINTARVTAFSNGRISHRQMDEIRRLFGRVPDEHFRVLVTHHPLMPPPHAPDRQIVGRAEHALEAVARAGVDLLLTGHYHQASSRNVTSHHLTVMRTILVSQAGTAISTRRRGEVNSYNLIRIDGRRVACEQREWDGNRFATTTTERYSHFDGHWSSQA